MKDLEQFSVKELTNRHKAALVKKSEQFLMKRITAAEEERPVEVDEKIQNFNHYLEECKESFNSYMSQMQKTINEAADMYFGKNK